MLTDLPEDLQWYIWRTYFSYHVMSRVRSGAMSFWLKRTPYFVCALDFEGNEDIPHIENVSHCDLANLPDVRWWFCPLVLKPYYFHVAHKEELRYSVMLASRRIYNGMEQDLTII